MVDEPLRPAWSEAFYPEELSSIAISGPLAKITRKWAWGDSTGRGVRVAIVDSGIEADHPALGGSVQDGGGGRV